MPTQGEAANSPVLGYTTLQCMIALSNGWKRRIMLALVQSRTEKLDAHRRLDARLKEGWANREHRTVVWRPGRREMSIQHNGTYWFGFARPNAEDTTPRFWNAFGEYHPTGNLHIAVEMNIPTSFDTQRVAGFFARDLATGEVYLMHDGGVGGGKKGVGKATFLAWSNAKLVEVGNSDGDARPAIIVAPVDHGSTADDIGRFVQQALDFKQAVARGETNTPQARRAQQSYQDYYDEFAGRKRRRRVAEVEYISRHGDIVRALHTWRQLTPAEARRAVKNAYIDLGIETDGALTELYEVKTSCDRQSLYSALGQMLVHDNSENGACRRFIVLPNGEPIPEDVTRAFGRSDIAVLRFELRGGRARILGPRPG